ncbi:multiubiquitin domain-containing protein [Chenggangzhangella methanolivorans]|uniref:Multiubiquitin domain-containing protein n=1 Tax=Chenggangzhangella methanolivorans TaxID=1437009 RepID=A0A9E6RCG2_9HYPH|nr:multiubiquitin domain-containing protein [Chenggangzhangella methanolivorans]QZO00688.1 multiubiquitin domain-containing protein [Chenggangzhangella methanolivorans]
MAQGDCPGDRALWRNPDRPGEALARLERRDQPDLRIETTDTVDLGAAGFERFRSERRPKTHRIYIGDVPYDVADDEMTGAQIAALGGVPADYLLFEERPGDDKPIDLGSTVKIRDGLRFYGQPGRPSDEQGLRRAFQPAPDAFPGASWSERDAGFVVHVPGVPTEPPGGWNMAATGVWFVAAANYPQAAPDCFFADRGLRLAAGTQPTNTSVDNPQLGSPLLWFSWHVARWLRTGRPPDLRQRHPRALEAGPMIRRIVFPDGSLAALKAALLAYAPLEAAAIMTVAPSGRRGCWSTTSKWRRPRPTSSSLRCGSSSPRLFTCRC